MTPRANRRSVVIPDDLWEEVQAASFRETAQQQRRVSVSEITRTALREWLDREEKEEGDG